MQQQCAVKLDWRMYNTETNPNSTGRDRSIAFELIKHFLNWGVRQFPLLNS